MASKSGEEQGWDEDKHLQRVTWHLVISSGLVSTIRREVRAMFE